MEATPILVWTMGKVGTSTVSRALSRAGIPALHMHSVRRRVHDLLELNSGRTAPHVKASLKALEIIENGSGPVKIISMVRDPIARNISAFFQNLRWHQIPHDLPTQDLIGRFEREYPHSIPLRWFDLELKECIGFDAFKEPFDRTARVCRYAKDRFEILIIRSDAELSVQQTEVSDFVAAPVELVLENSAEAKGYSAAYVGFKNALSLSEDFVKKMYSSAFARHFWTADELADMSFKYLGPRAARVHLAQ